MPFPIAVPVYQYVIDHAVPVEQYLCSTIIGQSYTSSGASQSVQHHHCAVLYEPRSICTDSTTEVLIINPVQDVQHEHYKEVQHYP